MRFSGTITAYAMAVVVTLVSVVATRLTWPFFSVAPFAPVFGAVAVATHWGSGGAGLLAIALGAIGLALVFPAVPPFGWNAPSLLVYVAVAIIGNRLIAGRNRAVAALRASDAELRATLARMRESDEQLRRAQKMEAVGQLAAGVAHNFNNLLQVTMGYLDVLSDRRRDSELDRAAIAEMRKATERGAVLTRQLMTFGRRHEPRISRIDLDEAVGRLRDMLSRIVREDIDLRMSIDGGGAAVMIDPSDLEQVIISLVINARDALPSGGTIGIESVVRRVGAANAPVGQIVTPGDYVCLRVTDNGTGMTPEVQSHLFEPFFTTKEVGEGTGLGLAFVHGVAQHAGGFTAVDSAPGRGTTVSVCLPRAPGAAPVPAAVRAAETSLRAARPATILLVEDEDGVRTTTERILTRAGYHVLSAANATEATAIFDLHHDALDLLLTDVVMPGMHGPELAARLTEGHPDLPVLFMSGYGDQMPTLAVAAPRASFVAKPFTATSLVQTVEGLLAAGRA
jgi:signal transduction histidine kinase/CheY-like chemotaxis protein